MAILSKLKYIPNWTQSEQVLVDFILKDPRKILEYSSRKLAEASNSSLSTVYRVCDKLDLNGFNELKLLLARELSDSTIQSADYNMPFEPSYSDYEIMQSMNALYSQTIDETMSLIDLNVLHTAVALLDSAKEIVIFTSVFNASPAQAFMQKMQLLNKKVSLATENFYQEIAALNASKDSVAIFLSYSGKNVEMLKLVQTLKQKKAKILLISSMLDQTFSNFADVHMFLCSKENPTFNKISSYTPYISASYIFDVLFSIMYRRHFLEYTQRQKEVEAYFQAIGVSRHKS
jgi:DNA-binding MurR/RpiR family transcriptional regulator